MHVPFSHIKRTTLPAVIGFLLMLTACFPCQAQQRLPDSIPGSMENTAPAIDTTVAAGDSVRATSSDSGRHEEAATRHDTVTFRSVPDSVLDREKKEKEFAYANDPAYWTPEKKDDTGSHSLEGLLSSRWFEYAMYMLLAAILGYALYKIIAENNLRFFYRKGASAATSPQQEPGLEEEDLDEGLTRAMTAGDHRLAIRYCYLKTLRLLDTAGLIGYHPQTTNEEYIAQLHPLPQGESFRFLTRAYERIWYGDFAITGQQFERLLQSFRDFYTSIPLT